MTFVSGTKQSGARHSHRCRRCQGLMVPCFTDSLFLEVTELEQASSWRCVNCGEWLDPTILTNRLEAGHRRSMLPRRRGWRKRQLAAGGPRNVGISLTRSVRDTDR